MKTISNGKMTSLKDLGNIDANLAKTLESRANNTIFEYERGDTLHFGTHKEVMVMMTPIDGVDRPILGLPCIVVRDGEKSKYFFSIGTLTRRSNAVVETEEGSYKKIEEHSKFYSLSPNEIALLLSNKHIIVDSFRKILVPAHFDKQVDGTMKPSSELKDKMTPVMKIVGASVLSAEEKKSLVEWDN